MNKKKQTAEKMRYRFENFGGIISSQQPPFLAMVDRDYMRGLGLSEERLWDNEDESISLLSAPTEVHFAITNKCSAACPHCYMDAGSRKSNELDTEAFKKALDVLADMKVFHIALGGGEALERPDLFEIAQYAKAKGLVPNLTISGRHLTTEIAKKMRIFGQVNVSIDGIGETSSTFRQKDTFTTCDKALKTLITAGVPTGINCVIGKNNFDGIADLFKYAQENKLNEIEFLRFKPSGRAKDLYAKEKTTHKQNISLTPMLARLSDQYNVTAKIDCSFVPMFCYHNPPVEMLEAMATYGCEAGNVLLGIKSDGSVSGCSFLETSNISVFDLKDEFKNEKGCFSKIRTWTERAPQPCRECKYLQICKGGCHAVSQHVTGRLDNADPDCPFVVEYNNGAAIND